MDTSEQTGAGTDVKRPDGGPQTVRSPRRKLTTRWVVALAIASIMVVAGVTSAATLHWGPFARSSPSAPTGPAVAINIDPASVTNITHEPMSAVARSVLVQLFSPLPSSVSIVAQPSAGHIIPLFTASPDTSGLAAGHLSDQFAGIDSAWLSTMSPMTTTVSLQLYATMNVISNGTDHVYTYFNNLPYNPRTVPTEFAANVTFPAEPTFSVAAANASVSMGSNIPERSIGPGECSPGYGWEETSYTFANNIDLPLATVNIESVPAGSGVSFGISIGGGSFEFSFNGDTEYTSSGPYLSGVQMSSEPSWSGDDSSFGGADPTSAMVNSANDATVGIIALEGVDVTITNYEWVYVSASCQQTNEARYMTTLAPTGMSSSSYEFATPSLPSYFPSVLNSMKDWQELTTENLAYGGGGFDLYSIMEEASGYSNAVSKLGEVETMTSTISATIGLMIAAAVATGALPGAGGADATADIALLASIMGYAASFAMDANSISFSTTFHTSIELENVNQPGTFENNGALSAYVYDQSVGSELALSDGTYYPDMPLVYVNVT